MELENGQAVSADLETSASGLQSPVSGIPTQRDGHHPVAHAPHDGTLEERLHRLESHGWKVLRDTVQAHPGAAPVSLVLVGRSGILVLETANRFATTHRASFLTAAGSLAATLPVAFRNRVTSAIVLLGRPDDAIARSNAPATVDTVSVDQLELWALGAGGALTTDEIESVVTVVKQAWSGRGTALLTADELPPVDECIPEASLRTPPAHQPKRARWIPQSRRRGKSGSGTDRSAFPRRAANEDAPRDRVSGASSTGSRPDFTVTDVLRTVLVTFSIVVGIWFAGVLSSSVAPTTGEVDAKSPVTSSQSNQANAPAAQGTTGTSPGTK